jgi:hypothetical protein
LDFREMASSLLPVKLSAPVIAALSGRSREAVWKARRADVLPSFKTADVELWLEREIDPLDYLRAERRVDATERAYVNGRRARLRAYRRSA